MALKNEDRNELVFLQITGHFFFLLLAVLSLIFWKERQAFDAAHYLFEIANERWFFIAHQRPVGVVTQVLPVIASLAGMPLRILFCLYSFGDILWYYVLFVILSVVLKSRSGTIALLLILSFTVKYTFFCPVSELLQGMALIPVFYACLQRQFRLRFVVLCLLIVVMITAHPLMFFPSIFSLAWWNTRFKPKFSQAAFIWIFMLAVIMMKFLVLDSYDHQKAFYPVVFNDYSLINNLKDFDYILSFLKLLVFSYPLLSIGFAFSLVFLFYLRDDRAFLLLTAILAYISLIIATHKFTEITNYSERILLPLSAMIAIPLAELITSMRTPVLRFASWAYLAMILLLHLDILRHTASPYTVRIRQMEELIRQAQVLGIPKAIADENVLEQNPAFAMSGWSYGIETLMLSSLNGPDKSVSIAMQHDHVNRAISFGTKLRPDIWIKWAEFVLPVSTLNRDYFRLESVPYETLLTKSDNNSIAENITIRSGGLLSKVSKGVVSGRVSITNRGTNRINAGALKLKVESVNENKVSRAEIMLYSDFKDSLLQDWSLENNRSKNIIVKTELIDTLNGKILSRSEGNYSE